MNERNTLLLSLSPPFHAEDSSALPSHSVSKLTLFHIFYLLVVASFHVTMTHQFKNLIEVAPGFWNLRGSFTFGFGLIDIGTHMSFLRLRSGKILVVDTCDVSASTKIEIDQLTNNGALIEGVIATHPFHTMYFAPFAKLYPDVKYYGTPRHIRNIKTIQWAGDLNDEVTRNSWEEEGISIRIPEGADFVNPAENNHFISAFVLHKDSRTIHDDDTLMFFSKPGFVLRLAGASDGKLDFHPSTLKEGLYATPEAPLQFQAWVQQLCADWDFDNICSAHTVSFCSAALTSSIHVFTFQELR